LSAEPKTAGCRSSAGIEIGRPAPAEDATGTLRAVPYRATGDTDKLRQPRKTSGLGIVGAENALKFGDARENGITHHNVCE